MQSTDSALSVRPAKGVSPALWLSVLLVAALWAPELATLRQTWSTDSTLSHGPLVPLLAATLVLARRDRLRRWDAAVPVALLAALCMALLYFVAVFADIDFLKPLALILLTGAVVWYLGGASNLRAIAPGLGFLVFMIPWPTSLVDRLAFPLQMASSSYAAMFAGMAGVPVIREGVSLFVQADPTVKPIFSLVVAQGCSGLSSLVVLLSLGYLFACWTPGALWKRALLLLSVIPLTLFLNSVRIAIVLLVGSHGNQHFAMWVHNNEEPVLVFLCSLSLMGVRALLMREKAPVPPEASTV